MNLVLISSFLSHLFAPIHVWFFLNSFFVFQWFSNFFFLFFLNGIRYVVDLKASFFCKVWIKDVSHVSFLKRYWIVLLMYKSWILWWCYVCYIVFTFTQYFFFFLPPYTLLPSQTKSFLEIMRRCLDGSTRSWMLPRRMKDCVHIGAGKKYLHLVSVKTFSTGILNLFLLLLLFSFILDVAWH